MRHADLLAVLRKQGRTNTDCREILAALASSLPKNDAVAEIIAQAAIEIEEYEDGMAAVAELQADEMDNRRRAYQERGEYDSQTVRERFLWSAV